MESVRKAVRERILTDMLGSIKDSTGGGWKVLILDHLTTRITSSSLKMSDLQDVSVSVVEDLSKKRAPMPLVAVYFITPTSQSVTEMLDDFKDSALYQSVHIFFSSKLSSTLLNRIKECARLLKVVKSMKEVNLEFLTLDSRTMITEHPDSLPILMGDRAESGSREWDRELSAVADRLVTLFCTLKEFPVVRYRRCRDPAPFDPPGAEARLSLSKRLADRVLQRLDNLQSLGIQDLPNKDTCELLILDRGYDAVAPFIHEWTYECLVYDLLKVQGDTYKTQTQKADGSTEDREHRLDESDTVWRDYRHGFIAEVLNAVDARYKDLLAKDQQREELLRSAKDGAKASAGRDVRKLLMTNPDFEDAKVKIKLHDKIAKELTNISSTRGLTGVGEIEQFVVHGEQTGKEMMAFMEANAQLMSPAEKVRMILCYCATHPGKMDGPKMQQWAKAARISQADMVTISNLALMGLQVMKPAEGASGGFFSRNKSSALPDMTRQKRPDNVDDLTLFKFEPLLKPIVSDLIAGRLPAEQFPYVRPPSSDADSSGQSARTGRAGWARRNEAGPASQAGGKRLVVFIVGGATRGEMRAVHELSKNSGREVILGSTSVESPVSFLNLLSMMNSSGTMYGL